jgi:hypothetical protein
MWLRIAPSRAGAITAPDRLEAALLPASAVAGRGSMDHHQVISPPRTHSMRIQPPAQTRIIPPATPMVTALMVEWAMDLIRTQDQ